MNEKFTSKGCGLTPLESALNRPRFWWWADFRDDIRQLASQRRGRRAGSRCGGILEGPHVVLPI
jgi:hypothetical protein